MPDDIKRISATKQFNRLFAGPLDPTMAWDSMADLKRYLESPISYLNQIVACRGKAYIISEKDGDKVLVEIGTGGGGGGTGGGDEGGSGDITDCNCDFTDIWTAVNNKADKVHRHDLSDLNISIEGESIVLPGFHIGPEPPSDTTQLWIDTTEEDLDLKLNSKILEEFRELLSNMSGTILALRKEVEELKYHNCTPIYPPVIEEPDDSEEDTEEECFLYITEDGYYLTTEDDYVFASEKCITNEVLSTEDDYILITEEGEMISLEEVANIAEPLPEIMEIRTMSVIEDDDEIIPEDPKDDHCEKCEGIKLEILDELVYKADKNHRHSISDIDDFPDISDMDIMVKYHIGPEPPDDPNKLWIDTTDGHIDQTIDVTIMDEIRTMIIAMQGKIDDLNTEIDTIKDRIENPIVPPVINDNNKNCVLTTEDDFILTSEDGFCLTMEYEDEVLTTEDGYILTTEENSYIIT